MCNIDKFDDFDLLVLVHEAIMDRKDDKLETIVRITCGRHTVHSDKSKTGIFQQPLTVSVEQGNAEVRVDLLDKSSHVIAQMKLDIMKDLLARESMPPETVFPMRTKSKGVRNPRLKLTLDVQEGDDIEEGGADSLVHQLSQVDYMVEQHMAKYKGTLQPSSDDALNSACSGPLELFEGLGSTDTMFVGILGPPRSRKFAFGVWANDREYANAVAPRIQVDLLKIKSVQSDPERPNVFQLNYFDDARIARRLVFRRIDRPRDVWVELLQRIISRTHQLRKSVKDVRKSKGTSLHPSTPSSSGSAQSPSGSKGRLLLQQDLGVAMDKSPSGASIGRSMPNTRPSKAAERSQASANGSGAERQPEKKSSRPPR